jgi:hypothetical protein
MVAMAALEKTRLERISGWPLKGFDFFTQLQRNRLIHGIKKDITVSRNPEVPVIDLYISSNNIEKLNFNLPLSGFKFKNATVGTPTGFERVKVRYRGDMSFHWFYPKKSWRIRTDRMKPLPWGSELDLINPKDEEYLTAWANSLLAKEFHLLTSMPNLVALNVNRRFKGVYLCTQKQDESFLRDSGEMPGEILVGDLSNSILLPTNSILYPIFLRSDPVLWGPSVLATSNPYTWVHSAKMNPPVPWGEHPLLSLIRQINVGNYWKQPSRLMDENYMARFCAFVTLVGAWHYDDFHNLRLFWDPSIGKFKMLEWDTFGWTHAGISEKWEGLDVASNMIFLELLRNPVFNYEKNLYLYSKITNKEFISNFLNQVIETAHRISPFVQGDKIDRESFNFRSGPDSSYSELIELMIKFLKDRITVLRSQMDQVTVSFVFREDVLRLDVDGVTPCENIELTFGDSLPEDLSIFRDVDGNGQYDKSIDLPVGFSRIGENSVRLHQRLYPGRISPSERSDFKRFMVSAPLSYVFLLRSRENLPKIISLFATNSITGSQVAGSPATTSVIRSTESVHPWSLPDPQIERTTVIAGTHYRVASDWIIGENETVVFEPGVSVSIDPGVSILSYGKILCDGKDDWPISFRRSVSDAAWGVIALQGKSAANSRFSNTSFSGGSDASLRNVYYSGMVNVHCADNVHFRNCTFSNNVIGDDTLHVLKASVIVSSCRFKNTWSDAIDFDYAKGTIENCEFYGIGNDAIDLMSSSPFIHNNSITGTVDKGISVGERSNPFILNTKIVGSNIGIGVKDGSRPFIIHCEIMRSKTGIYSYSTNRRYADGGHAIFYDSVIREVGEPIKNDEFSDLTVYESTVNSGQRSGWSDDNVSFVDCETGVLQQLEPVHNMRRTIFRDDFKDDFLRGLGMWQFNPEHVRVTKKKRFSELSSVSRDNAIFQRDLSGMITGGALLVDGRAKIAPVSLSVGFFDHDTLVQHETVWLPVNWTRLIVMSPEKAYNRVSISFDTEGQRMDLRTIELFNRE